MLPACASLTSQFAVNELIVGVIIYRGGVGIAAAGAPRGPGAQLYLSFPREFVETKQRGVNTVNISPLAYSAAEGLGKQQIECGESRIGTQGRRGLNAFMASPLTPLRLLLAGWKVLGCFTEGLLGPKSFFFLHKVPERSYVSGWEWGVTGWSIASVSAHSWKENFLGPAVLKCQAW